MKRLLVIIMAIFVILLSSCGAKYAKKANKAIDKVTKVGDIIAKDLKAICNDGMLSEKDCEKVNKAIENFDNIKGNADQLLSLYILFEEKIRKYKEVN